MDNKKLLRNCPLYILGIVGLSIICLLADDLSRKLYWDGDQAIYLVDIFDASRFEQMLGISSRFGWSHPGPLNYYFLLPFYWISNGGDQGLVFGTAVLNFFVLYCSFRLIEKMTNRALSIAFLLIFSAYMSIALGAQVFFDVLLPFVTIIPWVLSVCLACAVVLRGWKYSVFLAITLAYLTQAHVAFWIPAMVLALSSMFLSPAFRRPNKKDLLYLVAAAIVFSLLWIPPVIELKNLEKIFKFFASQPLGEHSLTDAFRALAVMMGEPMVGKVLAYKNVSDENDAFFFGSIILCLAPILIVLGYCRKNRFVMALGGLVIFQILAYLFSLTKIVGPILHHSVTFIPVISVFIFIQLLSLAYKESSEQHVAALNAINVLGIIALLAFFTKSSFAAIEQVKMPNYVMKELAAKLEKGIDDCVGPATVKINTQSWMAGIGAASYAHQSGKKFSISPHDWNIVFSNRLPLASTDCQLDFTWENGVAGIKVTDYGNKNQFNVVPRLMLHDLIFTKFGVADFGNHTVRSATLADASLVSNEIKLERGLYKAEVTYDYDITSQIPNANGAHISIHGKTMLLPILTGRKMGAHTTFYFQMDGEPAHFSFGLGGWAKGKGYVELKQFTISSVKKITS